MKAAMTQPVLPFPPLQCTTATCCRSESNHDFIDLHTLCWEGGGGGEGGRDGGRKKRKEIHVHMKREESEGGEWREEGRKVEGGEMEGEEMEGGEVEGGELEGGGTKGGGRRVKGGEVEGGE